MIRILREFNNVVVPGGHWKGSKFHRNHAAGASLLNNPHVKIGENEGQAVFARRYCLYFRGVVKEHLSRIGMYSFNPNDQLIFDGYSWDNKTNEFALDLSLCSTEVDDNDYRSQNAPCATLLTVNSMPTVFLYYNEVLLKTEAELAEEQNNNPDTSNIRYYKEMKMRLATSTNGKDFVKQPKSILTFVDVNGNPVRDHNNNIVDQPFRQASVVTVGNVIYMMGHDNIQGHKEYYPWLFKSTNGYDFQEVVKLEDFLDGSNQWDSYSISTNRMFYKAPYLYLVYCAGNSGIHDYNEFVGLARVNASDPDNLKNPTNWIKYGNNPIMMRGACGMYDEGGVWTPCFFEHNGTIHVFYEGFGSGEYLPGSTHSRHTRDAAYGGIYIDGQQDYDEYSFSSILHGKLNVDLESVNDNWTGTESSRNVYIKNVTTGKYLKIPNTANSDATMEDTPQEILLETIVSIGDLSRFKKGNYYLRLASSNDGRKLCYTLKAGTLADDKKADFLLYQVGKDLFQIQNRHSGLYLCPYANGGEGAYVGQGLDTGTNMTLWEITPVPET